MHPGLFVDYQHLVCVLHFISEFSRWIGAILHVTICQKIHCDVAVTAWMKHASAAKLPLENCGHNISKERNGADLWSLQVGHPLGTHRALGGMHGGGQWKKRAKNTELVEDSQRNGWRARFEPTEVGYIGFAADPSEEPTKGPVGKGPSS